MDEHFLYAHHLAYCECAALNSKMLVMCKYCNVLFPITEKKKNCITEKNGQAHNITVRNFLGKILFSYQQYL